MALSAQQIYAVARQAGFSPVDATTATAIALAESGGNPAAHNGTPPDNSYGLWQINMIGGLGPARRQAFGLTSDAQLLDPVTNARAAKAIHDSAGGWSPWTTYTHGAYTRHIPDAIAAAKSAPSSPGGLQGLVSGALSAAKGLVSGVTGGVGSVGSAVAGALTPPDILGGARRIALETAFVVLGLALVGVGVVRLVAPSVRRGGQALADVAGPALSIAGGAA